MLPFFCVHMLSKDLEHNRRYAQRSDLVTGRSHDLKRMEDDVARAQQARLTAEAAMASVRAAAEAEADALRQQLLQTLHAARDAELRASNLQERAEHVAKDMQMSEGQLVERLQDQLFVAETALAAERASGENIQYAAVARERELQAQLSTAAAEFSSAQQTADARATALATAEERITVMERDLEAQAAELATVQERLRR